MRDDQLKGGARRSHLYLKDESERRLWSNPPPLALGGVGNRSLGMIRLKVILADRKLIGLRGLKRLE